MQQVRRRIQDQVFLATEIFDRSTYSRVLDATLGCLFYIWLAASYGVQVSGVKKGVRDMLP